MKYAQCTLTRKNQIQVSFIPEKFAIKGKTLKLKNDQDEWENGWVVDSIGEFRDEDSVPDVHNSIKEHRKRTGDSMPKKVNR